MEKKKNKLMPVVIVLIILVLGLSGFIVYDKVLKDDKENNVVDNNNQENENKEEEVNNQNKFNKEEVKNWLNENMKLIQLTNSYDPNTADDKFYSRFLGIYVWGNGDGVKSELIDNKWKYTLAKSEGKKIIKRYFNVSEVNLSFNDINTNNSSIDNNSIIEYSEDKNNFYALAIPTSYDAYTHNLIQISLNNQNQIEVLYSLLGSYMNNENALSYYGYKKLVLEEVDNQYKILKIETNLEEYN